MAEDSRGLHNEFDTSDPRTGATGQGFQIAVLETEVKKLRSFLWDAYAQFAYETSKKIMIDGGLSTLEDIREELGIPKMISREDFIALRRKDESKDPGGV